MISVQKSSPRLANSYDPIPFVIEEVKLKFEAIPQDAADRKDRCWQVVTAQKCGLDVLRAASIFFETFPAKTSVNILCSDGVELKLSLEVFEAFKKDSGTLRGLAEDVGVENLYLNLDSNTLVQVLAILYPDVYKIEVQMDIIARLTIANYLDIPHLIKRYVAELKRTIHCYKAKDYNNAHVLYKLVLASPLRTQPFMKELIETEFAEYFGYFLQLLKEPDCDLDKYTALVFEKPVNDEFLAKISNAKNLTYLRIERGSKLSKWPQGFTNLKTLVLKSFPLNKVTFPNSLRSLTITYIEERLSDLLPISTIQSLRSYPLNLEYLSLSCYCTRIQLEHVPWSLRELVLKGKIFIIDLYMLPPTLFRFEYENPIGIKNDNFQTSLTILNLSYNQTLPMEGKRKINSNDLKILPLIELKFADIDTLGKDILEAIPETVRTLDILDYNLNAERLRRLPPNLESLKAPIQGNYFSSLPRLKKLDLSGSQHVKDEHLMHLRSDLEELTLSSSPGITNKGLANLPKGLMRLALLELKGINNQGIAEIPRKITHLTMSFLAITTACFIFIPREVVVLSIFAVHLDNKNYEHLPQTLEKYYTDNSVNISIPGVKVYVL